MSNSNEMAAEKKPPRGKYKQKRRSCYNNAQIEALLQHMKQNRLFAVGRFGHQTMEVQKRREEWQSLGEVLNSLGPYKTVSEWRCVWRDLKHKAKLRLRETNVEHEGTETCLLKPLTELDEKVLQIIRKEKSVGTDLQNLEFHEVNSDDDQLCLIVPEHPDVVIIASETTPTRNRKLDTSTAPSGSSAAGDTGEYILPQRLDGDEVQPPRKRKRHTPRDSPSSAGLSDRQQDKFLQTQNEILQKLTEFGDMVAAIEAEKAERDIRIEGILARILQLEKQRLSAEIKLQQTLEKMLKKKSC